MTAHVQTRETARLTNPQTGGREATAGRYDHHAQRAAGDKAGPTPSGLGSGVRAVRDFDRAGLRRLVVAAPAFKRTIN